MNQYRVKLNIEKESHTEFSYYVVEAGDRETAIEIAKRRIKKEIDYHGGNFNIEVGNVRTMRIGERKVDQSSFYKIHKKYNFISSR